MHVNVYVDVCARVYYFQNLKVKLVVFSYFYNLTEEEEKKTIKIYVNFLSLTLSISIADSEKLFYEMKEKTSY